MHEIVRPVLTLRFDGGIELKSRDNPNNCQQNPVPHQAK